MNLFQMNENIEALKNRDDLDPEAIADTLEALELSRDEKLDGVAAWIENLDSDVDFIAKKKRELDAAKKDKEDKRERLMAFMTRALDDAGVKELRTDHHLLKPRNYAARVVVTDAGALPVEFMKEETTYKPKKAEIGKALKAGRQIAGAHLEPNRKTVIK